MVLIMKCGLKKFNVLFWNFNRDTIEQYDVLPYFRERYRERAKRSINKKLDNSSEYYKVPKTKVEFKDFVKNESQHQFWSRCEYEMIIHGWPIKKNEYKIDIHEQIMMNIDIIVEILYNEMKKNKL